MSEVFDKDYFENGLITSKSCYENYRWIPELTYPLAHSLINFLHLKPDFKILEYGCAHGFLVKALNDLFIPTFGVDISTYAINSCPNDVSNKLLKIKNDFIHSDIKNHFGINNFNYCISKDVFEHIEPNKLKYIVEELSFLCKKLFVIVPLGDNGIYRINTYHLDPTHIIAENEQWWINFFKKNGGYQLKSFNYDVIGIKDRWNKINAKGNGFFLLEKI
jgi:hypothetical protein